MCYGRSRRCVRCPRERGPASRKPGDEWTARSYQWGAMPPARCLSPEVPPRYRPRDARGTPLYRLVQDHLEDYLLELRLPKDRRPSPYSCVEKGLRAFLECGIHRFGVVRFRCRKCEEDIFVAFSCRKRGLCPSCGAKRSAQTAAHALDHLLPAAAYRQWVLVLPKRLRYFIHRKPELEGEISRIFARVLDRHLKNEASSGSPAQIHFIQRITSDKELPRLLANLGLPADFPVIALPRSPPPLIEDESQLDPSVDAWDGIDCLGRCQIFAGSRSPNAARNMRFPIRPRRCQ